MLNAISLNKKFGDEHVLKNISVEVNKGETLSVLGKSGCGKTTLLKILAGLEEEDNGEIYINQQLINDLSPQQRKVIYLSQETLLFPHLSVFDNIAFGLKIRKIEKKEIENSVNEMLKSLDLTNQSNKMPHQISGGQQQRVSFGRALIINPSVLLLDEPFGKLDADTRKQMQDFYRTISLQFSITSLFVTHDLKEAMTMGNKIGYMEAGQLRIYKTIHEFINDPKTGAANERDFWRTI